MSKVMFSTIAGLGLMILSLCACQSMADGRLTPTPDSSTDAVASVESTATLLPSVTPLLTESPTISPTHGPTPIPTRTPSWTFQTEGAIWGSPTIADGLVYFGSDDHRLYAVDGKTGLERWRFETGGLIRSHPALADGILYFTSDDGFLYALEAGSGRRLWNLDIGNAAVARRPIQSGYDYLQSSPVVDQGMVYTGSADGNLYAVDALTGEEKWRFQAAAKIRSSPAVSNGFVYVGDWTDTLYALDARNGMEMWRYEGCGDQPTPTVAGGVVYVGGRHTNLYALNALTGMEIWHFKMGVSWVESSATVLGDRLYIGSSDNYLLHVLDSQTGEKLWEFSTAAAFPWSTPAVADGVVYIGSAAITSSSSPATCMWSGCLRAIDTTIQTELWQIVPGKSLDPAHLGGVVSSPQVVNGVVYFGGLDGKLYAVRSTP